MDRGLAGDGSVTDDYADSACGELNMIAVSNPCVLDRTLAPDGYIVVHAYGAGNEPYDIWKGLDRSSDEYKALKEVRATALWRAVESVIPDVRKRAVMSMIGSPITHERFLRRPRGTYGAATEDYLKDGSTPFQRLVLCGDSIFPVSTKIIEVLSIFFCYQKFSYLSYHNVSMYIYHGIGDWDTG